MFKLKVLKKIVAITANLSLLLNSFLPFLLVAQPAYAQSPETIVSSINYDSSANKINVTTDTSEKVAYQLFYKADENINAIAGSDLSQANFYLGTCSAGVCLPQNVSRGILKIESDSEFYSQFFTLENNVLTVTQQSDSTQSDLTTEENDFLNASVLGATTEWTFKNVELNKEYVAPQNSGVKLTFTKLPEISGNIKIEEITLTKEQIEQTGSLSDKAYDITSDMEDGTFAYNLSLPIPESSKGQNVDIKFAEEISQIDSAQTASNTTETNSVVSATNLDHFTIFIVTNPALTGAACISAGGSDTSSCYSTIQSAIDNAPNGATIKVAAGTYNENIIINKPLTLLGANADIPYGVSRGPESIIKDTSGGNHPVSLGSSLGTENVTINGFEITGELSNNAIYCGNDGASNLNIRFNYIHNIGTLRGSGTVYAINYRVNDPSSTNINISDNYITEISNSTINAQGNSAAIWVGQSTAKGTVSNLKIERNVISNVKSGRLNKESSGIYIGVAWGVGTGKVDSPIINSNTITNILGYTAYGIELSGKTPGAIVTSNIINNIKGTISASDIIIPITNTGSATINISKNSLTDAYYGLSNGTLSTVNAMKNWWGSATPSFISSILGNVNHDTWCLNSSCIFTLPAPTNLTPINNTYTTNPSFNNTWTAVEDAVGYEYQTSYSSNGSSLGTIIYHDSSATLPGRYNLTGSTIIRTNINAPNATYYWQVRAIDADGNTGVWSDIYKVTVDTQKPSKPSNLNYSTTNGTVLGCSSITNQYTVVAKWEASTDTNFSHYEYKSFNPTTGWVWNGGNIGNTLSRVGTLNGGEGTYGFAVRAVDKAGNVSDWTSLDLANSCKITYDKTSPIITLGTYTTTPTNQDITVTATTDKGTLNIGSTTFTSNGSFDFIATDSAGNSTTKTVTINNIDKEKPTTPQSMDFKNPNLSCGSITNQKNTTIDWSDSSDNIGVVGYDYSVDYPNGNTRGKWNTSFTQSQYRGSLNEGIHYIQVRAKDAAGNVSAWTNLCSITYDSIAPIITVNPFITNNKNPTLTGTINDNTAVVSVKVNNINYAATNNSGTWSVITSALADGTYDVIASATDIAGNIGIDKTTNELTVDTAAPKATFKHFINETEFTGLIAYVNNINKLTFTGEYTDATPSSGLLKDSYVIFDAQTDHSFKFAQNGAKSYCGWRREPNLVDGLSGVNYSLITKESFTNCINDLGEGEYYMTHQVYDNAIRQDIPSITQFRDVLGLHFVVDKTNPIITASVNPTIADAQNGWYKTQPEITLTGTDTNLDKVEYQWDSQVEGSWTNYSIAVKPLTEGNHDLYYRAIDKAGNVSTIGSQNIKWDQTDLEYGPQNLSANPNPTSGSTSKIKWGIAKDNTGIDKYEIQWKLNDSTYYSKTVGAGTTEIEIDQLTEGRWTVKVIAFDQSGRTKDASIDLNVDRSGPSAPVLTLTNPGAGSATLSWNAISDAKDYIIWYGSVQGVHEFGARVGNVTSYTVKGLGAGNYYFIVKAVDEAQNQSNDSNEVNTGNIAGAAGTIPGQRAEGFAPEVLGATTEATPSAEKGSVLGTSEDKEGFNWWWLLLLLVIPVYIGGKKISKKKK